MSYPAKEIGQNIFSVVAGVLIALIIIIPPSLFGAFLVFSDTKIPKSQEIFSEFFIIGGLAVGAIAGGYITAKISTRKDILHGIITGLVLTFLLALVNNFEFDWRYPETGVSYLGIIPFVLIGAFSAVRMKKKITSNIDSSLPDTPSQ